MASNNFLHKVADVLEAVASEKEKLATELQEVKQKRRDDIVSPLAEKISFLFENKDESELISKLSSLDDETLSILNRVTGTEAAQLGGSAKIASVSNQSADRADSSFASWILS